MAILENQQTLNPTLPTFDRPPVEEVSLGIQFSCPEISAAYVGGFYDLVKADFPIIQQAPAIPPQFESFVGPAQPQVMMMAPMMIPAFQRQWFVSSAEDRLIQLQPDRLVINWRRRPQGDPYPRYGKVRSFFVEALDALDTWFAGIVQEPYSVTQCEVNYFNLIPLESQAEWGNPGAWVKLWHDETDGGEGVSFSTRHLLTSDGEPFARMTTDVFGGQRDETSNLVVNLTVRGRPLVPGRPGVLLFTDKAREAIVRRFDTITTPQAHAHWGRTQ